MQVGLGYLCKCGRWNLHSLESQARPRRSRLADTHGISEPRTWRGRAAPAACGTCWTRRCRRASAFWSSTAICSRLQRRGRPSRRWRSVAVANQQALPPASRHSGIRVPWRWIGVRVQVSRSSWPPMSTYVHSCPDGRTHSLIAFTSRYSQGVRWLRVGALDMPASPCAYLLDHERVGTCLTALTVSGHVSTLRMTKDPKSERLRQVSARRCNAPPPYRQTSRRCAHLHDCADQ
jgi:hypothetical protein